MNRDLRQIAEDYFPDPQKVKTALRTAWDDAVKVSIGMGVLSGAYSVYRLQPRILIYGVAAGFTLGFAGSLYNSIKNWNTPPAPP